MEDLSLHILDIAENALTAGAGAIDIVVEEDSVKDLLRLRISDDGRGMSPENLARVQDPFFTTRTTRRVGLGLPLLEAAARRAGGRLSIASDSGSGTRVEATFQLSHIDLQPLGDIGQTLAALVLGRPEVEIRYTHDVDGRNFVFDTRDVRARLNGTPIHSPRVIRILQDSIREGIQQIRRTT